MLVFVAAAAAYTLASPLSDGCHERFAAHALRAVRSAELVPAPEALSAADAPWVDDLPFDLPADLQDVAAAALLAGARDPDLLGAAPSDAASLIAVHGSPAGQSAHCLRAPEDDDPDGDTPALAACRAALLGEVEAAFAALDPAGLPDDAVREDARIWLAIAGSRDVPVPVVWWRLGRALHTLGDAYSHTFRDADLRVTAVLNFVDFAEEHLRPERDGAAHLAELDVCAAPGLPNDRADAAEAASEALLRAALAPDLTVDARREAVALVVDAALAASPGCDADNAWCDAAERGLADTGCSVGGGAASAGLAAVALILLSRRRRLLRSAAAGLVVGALGFAPGSAWAAAPGAPAANDAPRAFGLEVRAGASVDRLAAALSVGARWRPSDRFVLGLDVELNPWMSELTGEVVPGCTNVLGVLTREYPMRGEHLRLTWSLRGGLSRLNMTVYGAAEGSIGPAFGLALLGLSLDVGHGVTLVLEPDDVEVMVPHVTGVPLSWVQYRMSFGVRWGAATGG